MTPLPSPPLFIKVTCSQNYPPLLRSPSYYLTVIHHTVFFYFVFFCFIFNRVPVSDSSCLVAPVVQSSLPPRLRGPFLPKQVGVYVQGEALASEIRAELRLWGRRGEWWPLGCPWLTFSRA